MKAIANVDDRGFTFADTKGQESFISFRVLVAEVRRYAAALQRLGLSRGDRVALVIPDHQPFIVVFLAALTAGLVPVPMHPPLSLAKFENWNETCRGILRVAGATAIITVVDIRALLWSTAARFDVQIVTLEELTSQDGTPTPITVGLDDLAFLQFTSGSTGTPRGVMISHRNIAANCSAGIGGQYLSADDANGVSWLPLYHDMGLIGAVLAPLLAVRPATFLATVGFLKRPSLWFELIHRHRATATFAPNFAYALCARRIATQDIARWDLSCLRTVGCGSEPIAGDTLRTFARRFAAAGFRPDMLRPSYGLAEGTLVVSMGRMGEMWRSDLVDAERLRRTGMAIAAEAGADAIEIVGCGIPLPGHAVHILDETGRALPERMNGEVEFRGPSVTLGYFGDQDATARTYLNGGLRTGDLGYIAEGELFVTGRKKDVIIVRGRNYAPQVIEWSVEAVREVRKGCVVAFAGPRADMSDSIVIVCEATTSASSELERAIRCRVSDDLALTVGDIVIVATGCSWCSTTTSPIATSSWRRCWSRLRSALHCGSRAFGPSTIGSRFKTRWAMPSSTSTRPTCR
jgi:fatty-acyl-CoA synthase